LYFPFFETVYASGISADYYDYQNDLKVQNLISPVRIFARVFTPQKHIAIA
jgi:hypothetical protein